MNLNFRFPYHFINSYQGSNLKTTCKIALLKILILFYGENFLLFNEKSANTILNLFIGGYLCIEGYC
jgi:hypothetical protein